MKLVKGSKEAKEWGQKMKEAKQRKRQPNKTEDVEGGNVFNRFLDKVNPFNNRKFNRVGAKLGQVTNDHLLPITTQLYATAGDMVTAGLSSELLNEFQNYQNLPKERQKQLDIIAQQNLAKNQKQQQKKMMSRTFGNYGF